LNDVGKEVVQEVEQLQVDKKSRPLQDARITNCGELVPKSKVGSVASIPQAPGTLYQCPGSEIIILAPDPSNENQEFWAQILFRIWILPQNIGTWHQVRYMVKQNCLFLPILGQKGVNNLDKKIGKYCE